LTSGALRSRRVALDGRLVPARVEFERGRISAIRPHDADGADPPPSVDLGDLVLFPGLVDAHVHANDPGRADWEGFETATRGAAAGGVTTLVDMPLNCVPATTTPGAVDAKRRAAEGRLAVDVATWGGLVPESSDPAALEALATAGARGFKAFLVDSGVAEFPAVEESHLRRALPALAGLGLPLLVHAEVPGPIEAAARGREGDDPTRYATWLARRPEAAEVEAVRLLLRLVEERPFRLHVVHVASAGVLDLLAEARRRGLPVSAETCPHYLTFAAGEIPDRATAFKCAPPIRDAATRERLWAALRSGGLDHVASDHSPAPPALKGVDDGDFLRAWGGVASLELLLPATWTGLRARGGRIEELLPWLCERPAALAGLAGRKGAIRVGADADFVAWDPDGERAVRGAGLRHRHTLTPYEGRTLLGTIHGSWRRGERIFDGTEIATPPTGEWIG